MKNICKSTLRGKPCWIVNLTVEKGKRIKRYFQSEPLAKAYLRNYKAEQAKGLSDFAELSPLQLSDIRTALSLLPPDTSLSDCVRLAAKRTISQKTISEVIAEFLALKDGHVKPNYYGDIKTRLTRLKDFFKSFDAVTTEKVIEFYKSASDSPKTQKHYFAACREFFDFCEKKEYYAPNPFNKIHDSEIPKIKRKQFRIPTTEEVSTFFARLEKETPSVAGLYALVAFGGLRISEAQRLEAANINSKTKEIVLPFYKAKTGKTWIMINMPDNVWTWLKKYPPTPDWTKHNQDRLIGTAKAGLKFENNALRHAFATYHYSLHRNEHFTQDLMRHESAAMLKQTYLAGLVSKEIAQAYFEISPKT